MQVIYPMTNTNKPKSTKYSTQDLPENEREEWLHEVICQEYANVEITPPSDGSLFNEMIIYPWNNLRLSSIGVFQASCRLKL